MTTMGAVGARRKEAVMVWILRSGAAGIALALLVACGKDEPASGETPGQAAPASSVPEEAPPVRSSDEPQPQDVTRLVMQKKLDGQLEERGRLQGMIAELAARKEGMTAGKYASDLDAQIDGLRAEVEELDPKILLTRATLQQLGE